MGDVICPATSPPKTKSRLTVPPITIVALGMTAERRLTDASAVEKTAPQARKWARCAVFRLKSTLVAASEAALARPDLTACPRQILKSALRHPLPA
jgi:hypothetical protein